MFTSVITNKGRLLQNKQVDGAKLQFTRVVSSSSVIPIVNLREQTGLTNIKQTLTIQSIVQSTKESCYTMQVLLENTKLATAYNLSQIGFYAKDPDAGEILFAIAQLDAVKRIDSSADMPGYTLEMNFKFQNANNATVTMEFDPEGLMTREGVEVLVSGEEIAGSANGSRITIYDSTDGPLNDIKVFGVSEQETTNGYQLFDASRLNSKSGGGATITKNSDGSFTISGSGVSSEILSVEYEISNEDFKKLFRAGTLHLKVEKSTYPMFFVNLYENNSFKSTILSSAWSTAVSADLKDEYFVGETYKLRFGFHMNADKDIVTGKVNPMVYQDGDGTFEIFTGGKPSPNPDYPLPIESVGDGGSVQIDSCCKSLVKNTATTQTKNGITFTVNKDGTVNVNGTATSDVSLFVFTNLQNVLKVGEKYILNGSPTGCSIDTCYMEINHIWYGDIGDGSAFTYKEGITGCYIVVRSGVTVSNKVFKPMIRLATVKDGSYEQHKKSTAKVPLTEPLYGIPVSSGGNYTDENGQQWICDEIDLARGVHIQRIVKKTYNGDEGWAKASSDTGKWGYFISAADGIIGNLLCDRLRNNDGTPRIYMSTTGSGNIVIIVNIEDYMTENTLAAFKEALSTYPINVWYALAEPIETPLTEEQVVVLEKLKTFDDVTSIFVTADIGNLSVNYFKNTNNGKASAIMASKIVDLHSILGEMSSILDEIIGGA